MKRNYYPSKSSLLRRTRDEVNGTIGPGNPVILPSGITTVVVVRKRAKPFKAEEHQKKDEGWQGSAMAGSPTARNGGRNDRPQHKQDWKRRKNRPGKKTDVEHVRAMSASLPRPAKGKLVRHKRKGQHLDWSVF